ncbi:MAG TPA: hypothetical protein ENN07_02640 [candidate division Zixibacteria bacterium]|nr:hypothetical protein [candidate division Zixibacteria bacterium]
MLVESDMPVEILLDIFPKSHKWLLERGIHCTQCGEPVWGTIAELIESKGLPVDELLAELNEFLKEKSAD